jgi:hypothetical protein
MVTTICRRTTTDGILPFQSGEGHLDERQGDHYEYVAVYVDDLLIASREPQSIITALETTHKFKLKVDLQNSIWDATSFVTNMDD